MAPPRIAKTAAEISSFLLNAEQNNKLLAVNEHGHVIYAGRKAQFLHSVKSAFGGSASRDERIRENHALIAGVLQNKIQQEYGGNSDAPSQKRFELIHNTLISIIKPSEQTNPKWRLPAQRLAQFFSRDISEIDQVATEIGRMEDQQLLKKEASLIVNLFAAKPPHTKLLELFDGTKNQYERKEILNRYGRILFSALRAEGVPGADASQEQKDFVNNVNIVAQAINRIQNDHDAAIEEQIASARANLSTSNTQLENLAKEIKQLEKRLSTNFDISDLPKSYELQGTFLKQNKIDLAQRFQSVQARNSSNLGEDVIAAEKALVAAEEKYKLWQNNQALVDELQALRNLRVGASVDLQAAQKTLAKSQDVFFSYFAKSRPLSVDPQHEKAFAISLQRNIPFADALKILSEREALIGQTTEYLPKDVVLPLVDGERAVISHDYSPENLAYLANGIAKTQLTANEYGKTGLSIQFEKDADRNNTYRCKDSYGVVSQTSTLEGSAQNLIDFCGGDAIKAATLSSVMHQGAFASVLEIDYSLLKSPSGESIIPQIGEIKDQPIYDLERVGNGQIKLAYTLYGVTKGFASSSGRLSVNPEFVRSANTDEDDLGIASLERHTYHSTFEVLIDEQKLGDGELVVRAGESGRRVLSFTPHWDDLLS